MRISRITLTVVALAAAGLFTVGAAGAAPTSSVVTSARAGSVAAVAEPAAAPLPAITLPAITLPAIARPAKPAAPARPVAPAKPAAPVKPVLVKGTPCSTTARACVDLSARRAWLMRNGVIIYGPVPITSGRVGFRTPTGTFRVSYKDRDHVSSIYDASMPNSVFFNGGVAFHQGSLSVRSHGCIHLSRSASATFFSSLSPGDVVQVRA